MDDFTRQTMTRIKFIIARLDDTDGYDDVLTNFLQGRQDRAPVYEALNSITRLRDAAISSLAFISAATSDEYQEIIDLYTMLDKRLDALEAHFKARSTLH